MAIRTITLHPVGNIMQKDMPQDMSEDQLKELQEAFDLFDHDKDGKITTTELQTVMEALRLKPTDAEVKRMISRVDIDGNGSVEFNEFILMMSSRPQRRQKCSAETDDKRPAQREEDEVMQAFRIFDIDGDGLIDAQELKLTMRNLGENLSDDDVKAMIKTADRNGDGKIDYEEFVRIVYAKH